MEEVLLLLYEAYLRWTWIELPVTLWDNGGQERGVIFPGKPLEREEPEVVQEHGSIHIFWFEEVFRFKDLLRLQNAINRALKANFTIILVNKAWAQEVKVAPLD